MREHSLRFYEVKEYYDTNCGNKKAVRNAVLKEGIQAGEYEEIVGEKY